jgi:hypothetical protein
MTRLEEVLLKGMLPIVGGDTALQVTKVSEEAPQMLLPMVVTLLGMVKLVSLLYRNAATPMVVTLLGITKAPVLPPGYVCIMVLLILYRTPPSAIYAVLPASTSICISLPQLLKTLVPILVTLIGMVMLVMPELSKAEFPMFVTLLGMVMLERLLQFSKTEVPILVMLSDKDTLVRLEFAKAEFPMLVTLFGIVTSVILLQKEKASSPMLVTLLGITKAPAFPAGYECKKV